MTSRNTKLADARLIMRRSGSVVFVVVGFLALLALVAGVAWFYYLGQSGSDPDAPLLSKVFLGPYNHIVLEKGEVESSNNIEIRCEVRVRDGSGPSTSIIDVIDEGTWVEEGDWLISFDSSSLEQEKRQQKIVANTGEAVMIQSKALYETALIAKKEYLEGTYKELEQTIQNEIFVAKENLKKAQLSYESTKRLVARGLLSSLQLEGEEFRVDAASNELSLAERKLDVLEKYTRLKMVTQLDSDIQSAEVKWRNDKDSYEEEVTKLEEIEDQIAKCSVTAPQPGQVVYANVQSSRSGSEFIVEAGAMVRERQPIIRLPDPKNMQIKANINESRINLIHEGMTVEIRIDAFGDEVLYGEVTKVNKYAEPGNFWSAAAKQYATYIQIDNPPPQIRVGLTAEVQIEVERLDRALQIPVQAVYERGGKTFCLVQNGDAWDTREIMIGSTNDKTVAVDVERSGIRDGEVVVMDPRRHIDKFDASRFPKEKAKAKSDAAGSLAGRPSAETPKGGEETQGDTSASPVEGNPQGPNEETSKAPAVNPQRIGGETSAGVSGGGG